jgi:predicted nucleic acid-binding protein
VLKSGGVTGSLFLKRVYGSYSGLRRTYSDRKTRALEDVLPAVLAGFAEHAALVKERRRADEERKRQWREAEARRLREEAFKAREKQRMAFVDAIHEQLAQRAKLTAVLAHLESASGDEARRMDPMVAWVRRRLQQVDALISPLFLDISATFAKIEFEEPRADGEIESSGGYFSYSPSVELQLWSIDEEKGLATSRTDLQWAVDAGLVPGLKADTTDVPVESGDIGKASR